ncbi:MAG TPA: phospholipid scramblase-related protein [Vicinamibacterales bacterium]|jgi:uncharacterized protein YxjI
MFNLKTFLVKERVGFLKLVDVFDIYDPATGAQVGIAKENVSGGMKLLRLVINKRLLPTVVEVSEREGEAVVLAIRRGFSLLRSHVTVTDGLGREIGRFKSKVFSLGGGFHVLDPMEQPVAEIKGDWKGWNFRFLTPDGSEIGRVTKKWAGLGKELFTSADNYVISLSEAHTIRADAMPLLLAAGLAIDTIYKEK